VNFVVETWSLKLLKRKEHNTTKAKIAAIKLKALINKENVFAK
jgi:hypothetical protein